jgi:hypothetical protein
MGTMKTPETFRPGLLRKHYPPLDRRWKLLLPSTMGQWRDGKTQEMNCGCHQRDNKDISCAPLHPVIVIGSTGRSPTAGSESVNPNRIRTIHPQNSVDPTPRSGRGGPACPRHDRLSPSAHRHRNMAKCRGVLSIVLLFCSAIRIQRDGSMYLAPYIDPSGVLFAEFYHPGRDLCTGGEPEFG